MNHLFTFYGTGAAEGIPDPFCDCFLCRNAREQGGKDIRTRSMLRISSDASLDLGADAFIQAARYGDLIALEHVLVTHTHEDHLCYMMMSLKKMATHGNGKPVNFYLTDKAYELVEMMRTMPAIMKGSLPMMESKGIVAFHRLEFGQTYHIGAMEVTPLRGNHYGNMGEHCANYYIKLSNGKTLFYGVDTGPYLDETYAALAAVRLDYMVSECTYGGGEDTAPPPHGHLGFATCLEVLDTLYHQGTIDSATQVYLTHINHCHTATHAQLCQKFADAKRPYPITVAYDGMRFD